MAVREAFAYLAVLLTLAPAVQGVALAGVFNWCKPCPYPSTLRHRQEGPPKIRLKTGASRPIYCPCDHPPWGYFQPSWTPWLGSADGLHGPLPPPEISVVPAPPNVGITDNLAPPPQLRPGPGF